MRFLGHYGLYSLAGIEWPYKEYAVKHRPEKHFLSNNEGEYLYQFYGSPEEEDGEFAFLGNRIHYFVVVPFVETDMCLKMAQNCSI